MKNKLGVRIGRLELKNPVMAASGTFGYGDELGGFADFKKLGAVVSKTITLKPRRGNLPPRTAEVPSGLLNSIGLENPGVEAFVAEKLPVLARVGAPVIVSIASESGEEEFNALSRRLDEEPLVKAIELNISCPNIKARSGKDPLSLPLISQDARATYRVVRLARRATSKTLVTKLSPSVTCITDIALAAEEAGSDAVALINTVPAMSIDVSARRPKLGAVTGGLSGPAVRPIAVRMVWETFRKIRIPIIGMGGIMSTNDALEFILAGASAVSVGTATFLDPNTATGIIAGINKYLQKNKISSIRSLIGKLECR